MNRIEDLLHKRAELTAEIISLAEEKCESGTTPGGSFTENALWRAYGDLADCLKTGNEWSAQDFIARIGVLEREALEALVIRHATDQVFPEAQVALCRLGALHQVAKARHRALMRFAGSPRPRAEKPKPRKPRKPRKPSRKAKKPVVIPGIHGAATASWSSKDLANIDKARELLAKLDEATANG